MCGPSQRASWGRRLLEDRAAFTLIPNPEYPCPGLGLGNSGYKAGWITPDLNTDTEAPWGAWEWATKKGVPGAATERAEV